MGIKAAWRALWEYEPETWEVIATLEDPVRWTWTSGVDKGKKASQDVITWYLEQSNKGNRRYTYHTYGTTKEKNAQTEYEAPLILWKRTGILPAGAEAVDFTAIKNTQP